MTCPRCGTKNVKEYAKEVTGERYYRCPHCEFHWTSKGGKKLKR